MPPHVYRNALAAFLTSTGTPFTAFLTSTGTPFTAFLASTETPSRRSSRLPERVRGVPWVRSGRAPLFKLDATIEFLTNCRSARNPDSHGRADRRHQGRHCPAEPRATRESRERDTRLGGFPHHVRTPVLLDSECARLRRARRRP